MKEVSSAIEELIKTARSKGERLLDNGTMLFEPAPDIAPLAWRHMVFAPMPHEDLLEIEDALHQRFPEQLRQFFEIYNGISLYGAELSIWGKRYSWVRSGDAVWQPFDLVSHNHRSERPKRSPYRVVFLGTTDRGEHAIYVDPDTGMVGKTERKLFTDIETWPDFKTWLLAEIRARSCRPGLM